MVERISLVELDVALLRSQVSCVFRVEVSGTMPIRLTPKTWVGSFLRHSRMLPLSFIQPLVRRRQCSHGDPQNAIKSYHRPEPTVKPKHIFVEVCLQMGVFVAKGRNCTLSPGYIYPSRSIFLKSSTQHNQRDNLHYVANTVLIDHNSPEL